MLRAALDVPGVAVGTDRTIRPAAPCKELLSRGIVRDELEELNEGERIRRLHASQRITLGTQLRRSQTFMPGKSSSVVRTLTGATPWRDGGQLLSSSHTSWVNLTD